MGGLREDAEESLGMFASWRPANVSPDMASGLPSGRLLEVLALETITHFGRLESRRRYHGRRPRNQGLDPSLMDSNTAGLLYIVSTVAVGTWYFEKTEHTDSASTQTSAGFLGCGPGGGGDGGTAAAAEAATSDCTGGARGAVAEYEVEFGILQS
jgi:hypothetical protein